MLLSSTGFHNRMLLPSTGLYSVYILGIINAIMPFNLPCVMFFMAYCVTMPNIYELPPTSEYNN